MKRLVSVCVALSLVGACTGRETGGESSAGSATSTGEQNDSARPAATPSGNTALSADVPPGGARSVKEETEDFVFDYAYPAEAGAIPALAALLDRRLDRQRTAIQRQASEGRAAARENGFPFNKYSSGMEWKLVAELPDWLSLSGHMRSYTGGAHGIYGVEALVWDKPADEALEGIDLFISPAVLGEALGTRFCEGLDALRAERRPEPIESDDYGFNDCPPMTDLTVLVGSGNGHTFNRLTLYAGPYVAGPYAEGGYSVNLDVDQAVLGAVKPQYRESFSARR